METHTNVYVLSKEQIQNLSDDSLDYSLQIVGNLMPQKQFQGILSPAIHSFDVIPIVEKNLNMDQWAIYIRYLCQDYFDHEHSIREWYKERDRKMLYSESYPAIQFALTRSVRFRAECLLLTLQDTLDIEKLLTKKGDD